MRCEDENDTMSRIVYDIFTNQKIESTFKDKDLNFRGAIIFNFTPITDFNPE